MNALIVRLLALLLAVALLAFAIAMAWFCVVSWQRVPLTASVIMAVIAGVHVWGAWSALRWNADAQDES